MYSLACGRGHIRPSRSTLTTIMFVCSFVTIVISLHVPTLNSKMSNKKSISSTYRSRSSTFLFFMALFVVHDRNYLMLDKAIGMVERLDDEYR